MILSPFGVKVIPIVSGVVVVKFLSVRKSPDVSKLLFTELLFSTEENILLGFPAPVPEILACHRPVIPLMYKLCCVELSSKLNNNVLSAVKVIPVIDEPVMPYFD